MLGFHFLIMGLTQMQNHNESWLRHKHQFEGADALADQRNRSPASEWEGWPIANDNHSEICNESISGSTI